MCQLNKNSVSLRSYKFFRPLNKILRWWTKHFHWWTKISTDEKKFPLTKKNSTDEQISADLEKFPPLNKIYYIFHWSTEIFHGLTKISTNEKKSADQGKFYIDVQNFRLMKKISIDQWKFSTDKQQIFHSRAKFSAYQVKFSTD